MVDILRPPPHDPTAWGKDSTHRHDVSAMRGTHETLDIVSQSVLGKSQRGESREGHEAQSRDPTPAAREGAAQAI
jgi:hypothetical protein